MQKTKRNLITTVIATSSTLVINLPTIAANTANESIAKHIILFIGDGMNIEHEIATSRYLYGKDFGLSFHQLPYQGNVATWDIDTYKYWSGGNYNPNAIIPKFGYDTEKGGSIPYPLNPEPSNAQAYHIAAATDSASAATAMATGYKTDDGNIAWISEDLNTGGNRNNDGSLKTIAEWLRADKGYAIGVVSTVPFSHATPAAFVSHNKNRQDYDSISTEILTITKPEVVIGGGYPGYENPEYKFLSATDYTAFKTGKHTNEYVFVERTIGKDGAMILLEAAEQAVLTNKKLFGLFGMKGFGNFESIEPKNLPGLPIVRRKTYENPSLAEATIAALKVLNQDPDGMFLMAEQGDIDWANHANDFQRMVGNVTDLHDAVQAVIDFINRPNDTMNWNNTLLIVTSDHSNSYMRNRIKLGAGHLPKQQGTGSCIYKVSICTYPEDEVTYASNQHTNELVRLYAKGIGEELLRKYENNNWYEKKRILDNTHIFHIMMEAAGKPQAPLISVSID